MTPQLDPAREVRRLSLLAFARELDVPQPPPQVIRDLLVRGLCVQVISFSWRGGDLVRHVNYQLSPAGREEMLQAYEERRCPN